MHWSDFLILKYLFKLREHGFQVDQNRNDCEQSIDFTDLEASEMVFIFLREVRSFGITM